MSAQTFDKVITLASVTGAADGAAVELAAVGGLPAQPRHGIQFTLLLDLVLSAPVPESL